MHFHPLAFKKPYGCIDPPLNFSLMESHAYRPIGQGKRMADLQQKADIDVKKQHINKAQTRLFPGSY
jgi:hypothetical protein